MNPPGELLERMGRLGIRPADLEEEFIRGSGPGGQKINKTSSTVRLRHIPTGIEVRCQQERSLAANRELALRQLCGRIEALREAERARRQAEAEQERRRRRGKPRALKRRQVESKRRRSAVKARRRFTDGE